MDSQRYFISNIWRARLIAVVTRRGPWDAELFLLGAAAFVGFIYFSERGGLRPRELLVKLAAGLIRFALVAVLVTMLYGWMLHRHRTDLQKATEVIAETLRELLA